MKPSEPEINYEGLVEAALVGVVRQILDHVAKHGLVGESHYYINFNTNAANIVLPDFLRARFPHEMTIVLQHQFWGLKVRDDDFSVTLSFGGELYELTIPYAALISFADPAREFGLRFSSQTEVAAALSEAAARALERLTEPKDEEESPTENHGKANASQPNSEGATILTLPFGAKKPAPKRQKRTETEGQNGTVSPALPIAGSAAASDAKDDETKNLSDNVVAFPGNKRKK